MQSERFEMRAAPELLSRIDEWRRQQPDIPARAEAIRRLIEAGLSAIGGTGAPSTPSGGGKGKTDTPPKSLSRAKTNPVRSAAPERPVSKQAQLRAMRENRPL